MLDFGSAIQYKKDFCNSYYKVIQSAINQSFDQVIQHSKELGFLNGEESQEYKETHFRTILHVADPFLLNQPYDFSQ